LIGGVFAAVVLAAVALTFLPSPLYEASSRVLVKTFREDPSRPGIVGDRIPPPSRAVTQDEVMNTEVQILTERELAEKVIGSFGLAKIYPALAAKADNPAEAMELAVHKFRKQLQVTAVRKSSVITVSFRHSDPQLAAAAVNRLVDLFKEKHLAVHSEPQSSFITSQLAAYEEKLKASERNLQEYQQKSRVYSLEEQRALLLRQRTEFDSSYKIAWENISEGKRKVDSLKAQMRALRGQKERYTQTDRDKIITDAKARLLELQLKEQDLRRRYTEGNSLVVAAKREVEMVDTFIREQEKLLEHTVRTGNPVYQNMETDLFRAEAELNSQTAKAEVLKADLKDIEAQLAALDLTESRIQNLKRELAINEKNYRSYADTHEDASISEAMNRLKLSNISVVEAAVVPAKPVKPKKKLNLAAGLVLGLFSGLAAAFLAESLAATFSDPQTVEKQLGLPVLVTIPLKEE
jgi:uncharacterized protein involved in exopolysaccharide biosynthesis